MFSTVYKIPRQIAQWGHMRWGTFAVGIYSGGIAYAVRVSIGEHAVCVVEVCSGGMKWGYAVGHISTFLYVVENDMRWGTVLHRIHALLICGGYMQWGAVSYAVGVFRFTDVCQRYDLRVREVCGHVHKYITFDVEFPLFAHCQLD